MGFLTGDARDQFEHAEPTASCQQHAVNLFLIWSLVHLERDEK